MTTNDERAERASTPGHGGSTASEASESKPFWTAAVSPWWLGAALLVGLILWGYVAANRDQIDLLRRYHEVGPQTLDIPMAQWNPDWNEARLRQAVKPPLHADCQHHVTAPSLPVDRICFVTVREAAGLPTLEAQFMFRKQSLQRVYLWIPHWKHDEAWAAMNRLGVPDLRNLEGVWPNARWTKDNGVFLMNSKSPLDPLSPSLIVWMPPEAAKR